MFVSLSRHSDSIYLADTVYASLAFDYEELKTHIYEKDTALLKAMIDSGSKEIISPYVIQSLLLPYKVRILTRKEFSKIEMPEPRFDREELLVLDEVDSLQSYINFNSPDSLAFKPLYSRETKLMQSKPFKSYIQKIERARKRMMFFCPFLRFRGYILMVMIYYNSYTNSATIARIFPASAVN